MSGKTLNSIDQFLFELQANGRYSFSMEEALGRTSKTPTAAKREMDRLKQKGTVVAVRKGFYTIVPPEYSQAGLMPPELFIHPMMQWLNKPYYVGLLSAASLHGAAHQQPQELMVVIKKPALRSIQKKGYKVRFVTRNSWPEEGITEIKTDTGYINVSSPELTCIDLVSLHNIIGGLNRTLTVIQEMLSEVNTVRLNKLLQSEVQTVAIQRLGYIAEIVGAHQKLIQSIEYALKIRNTFWAPLLPGIPHNQGDRKNKQWKIIENTTLESDL
jgi:predicted transcriptional regulator of viral defense system